MDMDSNNRPDNNWALGFSFLTIPSSRQKFLKDGTRFLYRKSA